MEIISVHSDVHIGYKHGIAGAINRIVTNPWKYRVYWNVVLVSLSGPRFLKILWHLGSSWKF